MGNLLKLVLLCPSERRLLLRSGVLLWAARLGLWLLPFPTLLRLLTKLRLAEPILAGGNSKNIQNIGWAIAVASRYVPVATCLTQALAGQILLAQHGEPALLRIGVAKSEAGKLEAHAWVESRGRVVIGDSPELFRYTPLPSVQGELL
jgi:Transglutaminase-like superfamily